MPVRDEKYILGLVRYVHQNPVKAGVCIRTEEYKWSSDRQYRDIENKNGWTDTEFVLEMFSVNRETAIKRYKEFMAEAETGDLERTEPIGDNTDKGNARPDKETAVRSLDGILLSTGLTEEEYKLIKSGSRKRNLTEYKLNYAKEALQLKYTLKAIGNNVKVSEAAIFDLLKRNNLIS